MAEPGTQTEPWVSRMERLRDSTQQRVLTEPMSANAMTQLITDGKATYMGRFPGSPVRYHERWWRQSDTGWEALDAGATTQLDRHAERYRAAAAAVSGANTDAPAHGEGAGLPVARHEGGAGEQ